MKLDEKALEAAADAVFSAESYRYNPEETAEAAVTAYLAALPADRGDRVWRVTVRREIPIGELLERTFTFTSRDEFEKFREGVRETRAQVVYAYEYATSTSASALRALATTGRAEG